MRNLALAALAAIALLCLPALAATTTSSGDTTRPLSATLTAQNDAIQFEGYRGTTWATVKWQVVTAGSGGITVQYSKDGRANWLTAPYSVNVSAVSANPSTAPWVNNTPVVGIYETPLPANATDFQITYATAGTGTTIALLPGLPYVAGTVVSATVYDVTSGVNTALDTGILDLSGWAGFSATYVTPAGGSGAVKGVDDAGANTISVTVPASATVMGVFGPAGATATALGTSGSSSVGWRDKRVQATSAAVAALTSRIRIAAWR